MKIFKSTMSLYLNHLLALLVAFVMIIALYEFADKNPFGFSAITTLIYIMFMYTAAWRIGDKDGRKIPGYYPNNKMPLCLSVYTAIIPIILFAIYVILPDILYVDIPLLRGDVAFFVGNCFVSGTPDLMLRLWFLPFAAFVKSGSIFAYILQFFILPVIIFAGYYVGTKRFSIISYVLPKLMFKKDNQKK